MLQQPLQQQHPLQQRLQQPQRGPLVRGSRPGRGRPGPPGPGGLQRQRHRGRQHRTLVEGPAAAWGAAPPRGGRQEEGALARGGHWRAEPGLPPQGPLWGQHTWQGRQRQQPPRALQAAQVGGTCSGGPLPPLCPGGWSSWAWQPPASTQALGGVGGDRGGAAGLNPHRALPRRELILSGPSCPTAAPGPRTPLSSTQRLLPPTPPGLRRGCSPAPSRSRPPCPSPSSPSRAGGPSTCLWAGRGARTPPPGQSPSQTSRSEWGHPRGGALLGGKRVTPLPPRQGWPLQPWPSTQEPLRALSCDRGGGAASSGRCCC